MLKYLRLKTLDRYIIQKYLSTFFFSSLIFTLISVAIDFSDKVQSFIEKPCTLKNIVVDYYFGFIGYITSLLMPMYTLIAVVFFTSRLAFNAEILAILNAGVSFNRILKPYLIAGSIVFLLHLSLNHFIIPHLNKSRLWFEHTFVWVDQDRGKTSNVHLLLSKDVKVYIRGYNKVNKTANGLRLEKFVGNRVLSILEAENANLRQCISEKSLKLHIYASREEESTELLDQIKVIAHDREYALRYAWVNSIATACLCRLCDLTIHNDYILT